MRNLAASILVLAFAAATTPAQEAKPRPSWAPAVPVVGPLPVEEFAARLPEWEARAKEWKVAPETLERLREAEPARIEVVFGDWCQDSYDHLPPLVAALRAAANPGLDLVLVGVDRKKQDPTGAAARLGVERAPTIVVFRDEVELGRVIEIPATTMDLDVARILHAVVGDAPARDERRRRNDQ